MTTIVTRAGKGSPLTHTEVDTNFTNLNTNKLETGAIALGSAATPSISFTGDTNTGIYSPGADQLAVATNGTEKLIVLSNGNVGIGTTPAAGSLLHINSAASTDCKQQISVTTGTQAAYTAYVSTTVSTVGTENSTGGSLMSGSGPYATVISNGGAYPINFGTNNTVRATIDSSGRLLVGTFTARTSGGHTGSFQLEGTTFATATAAITTNSSDSNGAYLNFGKARGGSIGSTTIVQSGDVLGQIQFNGSDGTSLQNAALITASVDGTPAGPSPGPVSMPGRLVFSTTVDGGSSPTGRAQINNRGAFHMFAAAGGDGHVFMTGENAGTTYYLFAGFRSATSVAGASAAMVFQVFTNGNTQNTNNSYAGISDLKLKENIVDATSQWDDLKALQVRKYNFKEETSHQTHTQIGLIAQEVELVSPGLVNESPDRDEDGNDLGTVTKSVNYSVLYMKAVKALQEAMERIEALEADVAQLKGA